MLEDLDTHFHDEVKGCKVEPFTAYSVKHTNTAMSGTRCYTHKKDVCKCGWEHGHHYGLEESKFAVGGVFEGARIVLGSHIEQRNANERRRKLPPTGWFESIRAISCLNKLMIKTV